MAINNNEYRTSTFGRLKIDPTLNSTLPRDMIGPMGKIEEDFILGIKNTLNEIPNKFKMPAADVVEIKISTQPPKINAHFEYLKKGVDSLMKTSESFQYKGEKALTAEAKTAIENLKNTLIKMIAKAK